MFDLLKSATKAAASVIDVPVSAAADVVTLGGATIDRGRTYTADALSRLMDNVEDMTDPRSENRSGE